MYGVETYNRMGVKWLQITALFYQRHLPTVVSKCIVYESHIKEWFPSIVEEL